MTPTNQPPLGTLRYLRVTTAQGKVYTAIYVWAPSGWIYGKLPPQLNWLKHLAASDIDGELTKRGMKGQWDDNGSN